MRTPLPFAFPTDAPTFVVFRPWSHTDSRQMLTILEGSFASLDEAFRAIPSHAAHPRAQVGTIFPLGTFPRLTQDTHEVGGPTARQSGATPACITVSWAARSPDKLRTASRLYLDGAQAQDWADFCADLPENAGRRFGVLRAEGPIPAVFSPSPYPQPTIPSAHQPA